MRRKILTLLLSSFFLSLFVLSAGKAFTGEREQSVLTRTQEFRTLDEAEKHLEWLLNQRNMLVGDFYGINQTGHRYVLIFDRLGYIRYRIVKIDKEIKATRRKISKMEKMIEPKNTKEKRL